MEVHVDQESHVGMELGAVARPRGPFGGSWDTQRTLRHLITGTPFDRTTTAGRDGCVRVNAGVVADSLHSKAIPDAPHICRACRWGGARVVNGAA